MRRQGPMDRGLLIIAFGLFSFSLTPLAQGEHFQHCGLEGVRYEVIFLGSLGMGGGGADAINDRGEVAGTTSLSDAVGRAFVWDCERGMQNIGALSEDHYASLAFDINNRGQIVGQSVNEEDSFAFIWDRTNGMRAITDPSAYPYDINDWSEVILLGGPSGVSYWNPSTGLQALWERVATQGYGEPLINNLRSIGGMRLDENYALQFFNWNPRTGLRDLAPVPSPYFRTQLSEMNDRGDLVGYAGTASGSVAFLVTREGEVQQLESRQGFDTTASGINNRRQIVGWLQNRNDSTASSFIWDTQNGMRDLNELRTESAPQIGAKSINNWGWIAGSAARDGTAEAALIVPVPENSRYFRNLSKLSGPKLCRALDALKANAVVSCLLQGR